MVIDRSGPWWKGSEPHDVDEYLSAFSADGYRVARVAHSRCVSCGSAAFKVRVDETEGCAERECASCRSHTPLLDSAEYLDEADLEPATCPCGEDVFNVAIGFAPDSDGQEVRWVYLGVRCTSDGVLGCVADWKIDYSPSIHLYDAV